MGAFDDTVGLQLLSLEQKRDMRAQVVHRSGGGWAFMACAPPLARDNVLMEVPLQQGLAQGMWDLGDNGHLAAQLSHIFAAEVDLWALGGKNCQLRLLAERRWLGESVIAFGVVHAAELMCGQIHVEAAAINRRDGCRSFYRPDGRATGRALLAIPSGEAETTSGFGLGRHPVLGDKHHHDGTDLGASVGMRVWSVDDGRVLTASAHTTFGSLVEVWHPGGWVSHYAHLSTITVMPGQWVAQKEILGEVGKTGRPPAPTCALASSVLGSLSTRGRSASRALPASERV